jgi:hypothetical protein
MHIHYNEYDGHVKDLSGRAQKDFEAIAELSAIQEEQQHAPDELRPGSTSPLRHWVTTLRSFD